MASKRRFKVTTDSKHDLPIAPNMLVRQFSVAEPDKVWTGYITYIASGRGLAVPDGGQRLIQSPNGGLAAAP